MSIDWLRDIEQCFGNDEYIKDLKSKNFHGSITFNFSNGIVNNYDLRAHRIANSYTIKIEQVIISK